VPLEKWTPAGPERLKGKQRASSTKKTLSKGALEKATVVHKKAAGRRELSATLSGRKTRVNKLHRQHVGGGLKKGLVIEKERSGPG